MHLSLATPDRNAEITDLMRRTFTASEGAEEGNLIGALAQDLLATTPPQDLRVFIATAETDVMGAIIWTRLQFKTNTPQAFLLSPVAIAPEWQGKGVGQALIRYGLKDLQKQGVEMALTYGDPSFYSKVGFQQITESMIKPPQPLAHPEGWLAQSLTSATLQPVEGTTRCAPALNHPDYW